MSKLDDIRAEIVRRRDGAMITSRTADQEVALANAELEAHDRAVALFPFDLPQEEERPARAPRRDIGKLVTDALTDEPQHISKIATAIGVAPSRVRHVLERSAHARAGFGGWVRADGDHP